MSADDAMARFEAALAAALRATDPVAALGAIARDDALPAELRAAAAHADARGVRVAALLVARLRFERLMQCSAEAARWFGEDPATCTEVFRGFHRAVPPPAIDPFEDAQAFEAWAGEVQEE